ncbi:MAG TPA: hypothetical protein VJ438_06295 [Candidatus Nanoarchaeia archaeon]|nr:hypothetical protein [Candidatus Nanoarchaeia archaeon]
MKITFVFNNPKGKGFVSANTYNEIMALYKSVCDRRVYNYIKSLENNELLLEEVRALRKKYDIPSEGYEVKNWLQFPHFEEIQIPEDKYKEWRKKLNDDAKKLFNKLGLSSFLLPHMNAYNLVVGNFVFIGHGRIFLSPHIVKGEVGIFIKGFITKNELHKFIDSNWEKIKKQMSETIDKEKELPSWRISQRVRDIVKMRDEKKLTFNEIVERITSKYRLDPADASINEDSVKAAYHRAKKKMNSLTK